MIEATEQALTEMAYDKEPSTDGTWYTLDLEELKERGVRYVEIHFPDWDDDGKPTDPNCVRFWDKNGE